MSGVAWPVTGGWALVAALAAGVAVWCVWPTGGARLRERSSWTLPAWLEARLGSPPLQTRAMVGTGSALAAFVASGVGLIGIPLAWLLGVAVTVMLGRLMPRAVVARADRVRREVPAICELIAGSLDAGLPIRAAAALVAEAVDGPVADILRGVDQRISVGISDTQAWEWAAKEPGFESVGLCVARTVGSGAGLAEALSAQAATIRGDLVAEATARARRVAVSSVLPLMVCFLPAFFLLGVVPIVGGVLGQLLR